ncbi:hypothetical protein CHU98_g7019 [Xylaria longipes]|nr:hypothetical protein CHU98_g7019 [Xylaria longipes]
MSDQDRGRDKRPRDQDHGRNKRHRDQSSDTENRNESVVARRNRANENHSLANFARSAHLSAVYTEHTADGQQYELLTERVFLQHRDDAVNSISKLDKDTDVLYTAGSPQSIIRFFGIPLDHVCHICHGNHHTAECIHLNLASPNDFMKSSRKFRLWCPFHKRPHQMDSCNQKWTWLQDPSNVHKLLITESADAPPFATDLISWPDIVRDTDQNRPWSAEHSHQMWYRNMDPWMTEQSKGPIRSNRDPDRTTSRDAVLERLPYQTASGNPPQFRGPRALEELAAFAKQQQAQIDQEKLAREREVNAQMAELDAKIERLAQKHLREQAELQGRIEAEKAVIQRRHAEAQEEVMGTQSRGRG